MSYCCNCAEFEDKVHETAYGVWEGICKKFKIGRNRDTWACDRPTPIEGEKEG